MSATPPPPFVAYAVEQAFGGYPLFSQLVKAFRYAASAAPESVRVTSWWRDAARNREVGGSDNSQHLAALAFDLGREVSPRVLERFRAMGFVVVPEADHVHVQAFDAMRPPVLQRLGLAWLATLA